MYRAFFKLVAVYFFISRLFTIMTGRFLSLWLSIFS
jgi:hypothetical protein